MKTSTFIKTIAFSFIFGILATGVALAGKPNTNAAADVRSTLKDKLAAEYVSAEDLGGVVEISFTVNEDGSLNYKRFLSSNPEIGKFVEDNLKDVNLNKLDKKLKSIYVLRFTFEKS